MELKYTCKNRTSYTAKKLALPLLFLLLHISLNAQLRPPFSEQTVVVKERTFLPYTKGTVERKITGAYKPFLDKICSAVLAWDSISPPQGIKVDCYGYDDNLEIYFLPYLFEEGRRFASEGGPKLSVSVDNPAAMYGSPIVEGIFLYPQKTADFNGFPIYRSDHGEVTIVSGKGIPLFIPVTNEEYLNALIAREEINQKKQAQVPADSQAQAEDMKKTYEYLLKTDKEAAREFKQQMEEMKKEVNKNKGQQIDVVERLKKELLNMTEEEKKRPAYYGGGTAMEEYHNLSELVPFEHKEAGELLAKVNPALTKEIQKSGIQLIVLRWSIDSDNQNGDKPRFYNKGRAGFNLADKLMARLYKESKIWQRVFSICN